MLGGTQWLCVWLLVRERLGHRPGHQQYASSVGATALGVWKAIPREQGKQHGGRRSGIHGTSQCISGCRPFAAGLRRGADALCPLATALIEPSSATAPCDSSGMASLGMARAHQLGVFTARGAHAASDRRKLTLARPRARRARGNALAQDHSREGSGALCPHGHSLCLGVIDRRHDSWLRSADAVCVTRTLLCWRGQLSVRTRARLRTPCC